MLTTFRHFFASPYVLEAYNEPSSSEDDLCEKIKQATQLGLRKDNTEIPDHIYRHRVEHFWTDKTCLNDMLLKAFGISPITTESFSPLHIRNDHVYVQQAHFEHWQNEIVTYQSPLPHIAAAWTIYGNEHAIPTAQIIQKNLQTLQYASLPSIYENRLNCLIQNHDLQQGKLYDLHTHFNGSSEFTNIWLHALENKEVTYACLEKACLSSHANNKTKYFYKQLQTTPQKIYMSLCKAAAIREYICAALHHWGDVTLSHPVDMQNIFEINITNLVHSTPTKCDALASHPFSAQELPQNISLLQREGSMWVYIFYALQKRKHYNFSKLVHVYLLLMNLYARLVVHQQDQFGFEQFQYITCIKAYDALEDTNTEQRFTQFHGMYGPDLAHIEARFSPKDDIKKNVQLLEKIWNSYEKHHKETCGDIIPCSNCPKISASCRIKNGKVTFLHNSPPKQNMSFSLVAHFIKEEDSTTGIYRHQKLRTSLAKKARIFIKTKTYLQAVSPEIAKALVGKDAAANELDSPPEVFAPIFRVLHHEGITNTTYHAGEDFEHILSGIRAVHEAITFLNLDSGDRIGHATALGIAPYQCSYTSIFCAQGHWLDNLVWLTRQIHYASALKQYQHLTFALYTEIQKIYKAIYDKKCPQLSVLWDAWEMRHLDISLVDSTIYPFDKYTKTEIAKLEHAEREKKDAFREWKKYHEQGFRKKWNEKIKVDESILESTFLCAVQDSVITEMRQKNIIVEVLPSSNVRISYYKNIQEHHVLRWLDSTNKRPAPHVVLGTDDPGIFSTNLRNEYALLFNVLCQKYTYDDEKPYQIIQHIIENSLSYKFK